MEDRAVRLAYRTIQAAVFVCGSLLAAQTEGERGLSVPMKPGLVSVRVRLGIRSKEPATWQGTYTLTEGQIIATDGWRFMGDDYADLKRFKLDVRRYYPLFWQLQKRDPKSLPIEPNGFMLTLDGVTLSTKLEIECTQGSISVPVLGLRYGFVRMLLDRTVEVERVPTYRTVVAAATEETYPSASIGKGGALHLAYVCFTHAEKFAARAGLKAAPKDFADLAMPTGGDQVMFTELRDGQWTAPEPLTPPGGDIFRTAIASDGQGRVWVFWSAKVGDDWDIHVRVRADGAWLPAVRVTSAPGSDVNPVAATDSAGRVWLAWQGFRGGHSDIFAARQEGQRLGPAITVAGGPANEWTPAIAASTDGQVAVAWDSYATGDYNVHVRMWNGNDWCEPRVVAATGRNELRPSLAFDRQSRLWIAYESSPEGWGKDFGPYDQAPTRAPLYRERRIGLKVLAGEQFYTTEADVNLALPMPHGGRRWPKSPKSFLSAGPSLAVDRQGQVWLAARIRMPMFTGGAGTSWMSFLTSLGADGWRPSTMVPGTDGLLHETPELLPAPTAGLWIVGVSDGRFRTAAYFGPQPWKRRRRSKGAPPATTRSHAQYPDWWVNRELSLADTGPVPPPGEVKLVVAADDTIQGPSPQAAREAEHVAAVRAYRTQVAGKTHRILRGEFHRHTEISSDGSGDGTLFDMWRYGLDLAAFDWIGNGDHDNGGGREYTWWLTQKTTDVFRLPGAFTPMFTYERSNNYPDGHRNVVFAKRGVRTLPRLRGGMGKPMDELPVDQPRPNTPDTQMLYRYLRAFGGVCAEHTSGTDMGTDWRDNDPEVEPIVEIYQGDRQSYERPGAPRSNTADYSIGGWRPFGFVAYALMKGYRLGFQSSSDHISTHMSYCNVFVQEPSREAILDAMKQRHIYGATDNIIADFRCGTHFMGDEFTVDKPPTLHVKLIGTAAFARVVVVKDNEYVYSIAPNKPTVELTWTDRDCTPGKTSYYYVRGEQVGETVVRKVRSTSGERIELPLCNGELVWVSPMWITYKP